MTSQIHAARSQTYHQTRHGVKAKIRAGQAGRATFAGGLATPLIFLKNSSCRAAASCYPRSHEGRIGIQRSLGVLSSVQLFPRLGHPCGALPQLLPNGNAAVGEGNATVGEGNATVGDGNTTVGDGNATVGDGNATVVATRFGAAKSRPFVADA